MKIGRYEITGELGRGGMGVVHSAHDPALDRPVAVKVMRFEEDLAFNTGPEIEARFLREARLSARLHHPSVAAVYDAGREGNSLYLVMELVDGESLARRLQRGDFPSPAESLRLVAQVADALAAAHAAGIIHRDIKPGNILLARSGGVKVSDFGVAKAVGESTELTRTGSVLGSPAYMAPEQVQGQDVDARADLFSLGVVLYELLLRRRPFPADTVTTLIYQILHQDPFADQATFRALGDELGSFVRWTLAKQPADRVPDALTFAARARALAERAPQSVTTGATVILPPRPAALPDQRVETALAPMARKPNPWPWVAVAALVVLLLAALVWAMRRPAVPPSLAANPSATPSAGPPAGVPVSASAPPTAVASAPPVTEATTGPVVAPPAAPETPGAPAPAQHKPRSTSSRGSTDATSSVAADAIVAPESSRAEVGAPAPPPAYEPPVPVSHTFHCRKFAEFNVSPEEAMVSIEGQDIGIADDWDGSGGGKDYPLAPGSYISCFRLKDYKPACVRLVVSPQAGDDECDVDTDLEKDRHKRK